eukprot:CAMPEP_0183348830 /NCGR_PEP_ID=MMETSP0164_2-20130417/13216_1 /TAXON_ID=221442 /ORGANISM="Coccolithus pelagicus ssp braarudi, Strain PLY182g" /LENGTH=274 /DNA_ID=CAMNT_0025520477 /DNA_START=81 /DNA_END=906 /DNA_ORIENTATION=+
MPPDSDHLSPVSLSAFFVHTPPLARPAYCMGRRGAILACSAAALVQWNSAPAVASASVTQSRFVQESRAAFAAFERGDYVEAETQWRRVSDAFPNEALAHANLATCLIINASEQMTLGELPTGIAHDRLQAALEAIEKATSLGATDALLLNARGNTLGLLQRWDEARAEYDASAAVSSRDFESIPRSNAALISFQTGDLERVEREARTLMRRDPRFVDSVALLAAAKWSRGDVKGAAQAFERLCEEPQLCARYASISVVLGGGLLARWRHIGGF